MKGLSNKELLKIKLQQEIKKLEKKKNDLDFVTDLDTKIESARAARNDANKKYKKSLKINEELRNKIDIILEVDNPELKPVILKPTSSKRKHEAIANIVAGDWHCEEQINPEAVNYLNEYNPSIARQRVINFMEKAVRLINIERTAININEAVLAFLGDLFGAAFKEDLSMTNFKTSPDALLFCFDLCVMVIDYIWKYGGLKKLTIICKTGNHSRLTEKPIFKVAQEDTLEWILYHMIKKQYKNNKNIEFIIPKSYRYILKEYNYSIGWHHGDAIKYQGGIGGITVSANRNILRASKTNHLDLDVFGHHHACHPSLNFIGIGSLSGYSELAAKLGFSYQPPSQYFFLISAQWGRICDRPIYVDKNMQES